MIFLLFHMTELLDHVSILIIMFLVFNTKKMFHPEYAVCSMLIIYSHIIFLIPIMYYHITENRLQVFCSHHFYFIFFYSIYFLLFHSILLWSSSILFCSTLFYFIFFHFFIFTFYNKIAFRKVTCFSYTSITEYVML
jgi:hypothetical protein